MGTMIATLDSEQTLSLPPEATSALGLRPGSRFAVTLKDGAILLQPLLADSLDQLRGIFSSNPRLEDDRIPTRREEAKSEVDRIATELRDMFKGEPSLEDEYFSLRDPDKW
jgi:hypothetical protein